MAIMPLQTRPELASIDEPTQAPFLRHGARFIDAMQLCYCDRENIMTWPDNIEYPFATLRYPDSNYTVPLWHALLWLPQTLAWHPVISFGH